jgi:CubicO group peptidase (beta-lactamase class C family)
MVASNCKPFWMHMLSLVRLRPLLLSAVAAGAFAMSGPSGAAPARQKPPAAVAQRLEAAPLPVNVDQARLNAALKTFDAAQEALGVTQSVIVAHKGALVLERYGAGYEPSTRFNTWNVGGSVTAALTGRAVQTGAVKSVDERTGLAEWTIAADGRDKITLRNLLQMSAGLTWRERDVGSEAGSDAEKMLFGAGQVNIMPYATGAKAQAAPGETFTYSTGSGVLLASAVQRRLPALTPSDGLRTYAWRKFISAEFFDKLGMSQTAPQFDIRGNYYSSLIWMSARDMAAFGKLCLRDGVWNGERLLPEGWVQFMRTPSGAKGGDSYGAGFWIKAKNKPDSLMAHLPADAFAAGGDRGAVIVMIPSKDIVIVRTGITPFGEKSRAALGVWLGELAAAFPDVKS